MRPATSVQSSRRSPRAGCGCCTRPGRACSAPAARGLRKWRRSRRDRWRAPASRACPAPRRAGAGGGRASCAHPWIFPPDGRAVKSVAAIGEVWREQRRKSIATPAADRRRHGFRGGGRGDIACGNRRRVSHGQRGGRRRAVGRRGQGQDRRLAQRARRRDRALPGRAQRRAHAGDRRAGVQAVAAAERHRAAGQAQRDRQRRGARPLGAASPRSASSPARAWRSARRT